jgi:SAM-dependent methyltransferase
MGRWSRVVARDFVNWLTPPQNRRWMDIGCGTGGLSEAIVGLACPSRLLGVDQSDGFAHSYRKRFGDLAQCLVGDALSLPAEPCSIDYAVSGLVLNFISEPARAIEEMKRVAVPGGVVALYVWDYPCSMDMLNRFWDVAVALDPGASTLHEGRRFALTSHERLQSLFREVGLEQIEIAVLNIEMNFRNFDDYWQPFLGGQGPAPSYLMSLNSGERERLRLRLFEYLPAQSDGSIVLNARALAISGRKAKTQSD